MMNMAVAFFVCMAFCISVMAFLCSLSDKRKEKRWRREDEIAMRRLKRQDEENRRYCEDEPSIYNPYSVIEAIENGNADEYIERHISKEREEYDRKWREWYERREVRKTDA